MMTCPVCNGEAKVDAEKYALCLRQRKPGIIEAASDAFIAFVRADGTFVYTTFLAVLVGGVIVLNAWIHTPPKPAAPPGPSVTADCSTACGPGRFKEYISETPSWNEPKEGYKFGFTHPPVPSKCECLGSAAPVTP